MQDVLLTFPDLYFCYEIAKAGRRALTTLATRNLHVLVGRFNSTPPPPLLPTVFLSNRKLPQNVLRLHGLLVRRWRGSHTVAQTSENPSSTSWCFGHNCRSKDAGKAGGGKMATCDGDHFQETNTCMSSVRSMYVWSSRIAEYGSTG